MFPLDVRVCHSNVQIACMHHLSRAVGGCYPYSQPESLWATIKERRGRVDSRNACVRPAVHLLIQVIDKALEQMPCCQSAILGAVRASFILLARACHVRLAILGRDPDLAGRLLVAPFARRNMRYSVVEVDNVLRVAAELKRC